MKNIEDKIEEIIDACSTAWQEWEGASVSDSVNKNKTSVVETNKLIKELSTLIQESNKKELKRFISFIKRKCCTENPTIVTDWNCEEGVSLRDLVNEYLESVKLKKIAGVDFSESLDALDKIGKDTK